MSYRAVWRSAHQLILDHCDDASVKAAMNADDALQRGQLDAYQFWRSVIKAIVDMGCRVPVNGERLN
jgi:hypothetical protein